MRARHVLLPLAGGALLVACNDEAPTPDAMPDAAPRCDPSAPFGPPEPVLGLNTPDDDVCARLSPDELTIVFTRRRPDSPYDLFTASRPSREAPFENVALLATVNSINNDLWPTVTPDGLLLMFDSDRTTGVSHIYASRRASTDERFGSAMPAPALMDGDRHPMLANGRALYFSSATRDGLGAGDIYRVEVDSTGATSMPMTVVGGVNTVDNELAPAVREDELAIFFYRLVDGEPDIYMATRSTPQDGFGPASLVPGLAPMGANEVPNWISPDGCTLYFHSDKPDGAGGEDLYVARRGAI